MEKEEYDAFEAERIADEEGGILCCIGWDDEGECISPMDWKV